MDYIITEQEYEEYQKLKKKMHVSICFYDCRKELTHTAEYDVRIAGDTREQICRFFKQTLEEYSGHLAELYSKDWQKLSDGFYAYMRKNCIRNFADRFYESLHGAKKTIFRKLFAKQLYKLAQEE